MTNSACAVVRALADRTRRDGSRPLLTYLELETGRRMELSGTTAANWTAKVSWALDEAGVLPGEQVAMPVLTARPTHWTPLVWALGVWAAGAGITLDGETDVAVIAAEQPADAPTTFALSCELWGRACAQLPVGATDGADILGQPDAWRAEPVDPAAVALTGGTEPLTFAALAAVAPDAERRLVVPNGAETILRALAAALLGGGSLVLTDAVPGPELALKLADAERITA